MIGDGVILNGGESASIAVAGDVLSTDFVVATKGSKTRNGRWNGTEFIIRGISEYGTWTVTATRGTSTFSANVLIDASEEYEVEVSYS